MMVSRKQWVVAGASLCAAWLGWRAAQNVNGFCAREGRYVSDAERVRQAVEQEFLERASGTSEMWLIDDINGKRTLVPRPQGKIIPYASVEEFLRLNPNCCALTTEVRNDEVTWFDRMTGSFVGDVVTRYKVRFRQEDGTLVTHEREVGWRVGNCGLAFEND